MVIIGDINVNFFNYNNDEPTSEYLDMLLDLGYLPIITEATRITDLSATLIDHSYTNFPQKVIKSGICLAYILDRLPCFVPFQPNFQRLLRQAITGTIHILTETFYKQTWPRLISVPLLILRMLTSVATI